MWFGVPVLVKRSNEIPSFSQSSRNVGWKRSAISFGADALVVGAHGHGRAVLVAAGNHQHAIAGHAVVASEDVGRQVGAGDVAEVQRPVGVRPRHGDEYVTAGL